MKIKCLRVMSSASSLCRGCFFFYGVEIERRGIDNVCGL